jgi:hypothetical protein
VRTGRRRCSLSSVKLKHQERLDETHQYDDGQVRKIPMITIGGAAGLDLQHCTSQSVALNLNIRLAGLVEVCMHAAYLMQRAPMDASASE